MIRQERRRLTRDYQKELDKIQRASEEVYKKNRDMALKVPQNVEVLEKGECEDRKLQSYFNLMRDLEQRGLYLAREILRINAK